MLLGAFFLQFAVAPSQSTAGEAAHGVALGATTCGASTCHAAAEPWPNSSVSQKEYLIWKEKDPHARSYDALGSARAKAIARRLGVGEPTSTAKCLGCHALNLPADRREDTFDITEGVTCESCHGPASGWLGVHSSGLYFYAQNLEKGMYPTTDPIARADLCLGCHVGDGQRFVSHDMMAAGHPTLPFELGFYSWFTTTNPEARSGYAHFTVDDDYLQRKPWPFGVKVWALGQVTQARRVLALVTDPKNGPKGLFPELSHFECRSCHRSQQGPGVARVALPRIKSANLIFAGFAAEIVDAGLAGRVRGDIQQISAASTESWEAVIAASARLKDTLAAVEARLKAHDFSVEDNKRILTRISRAYASGQLAEYEAAEQAVLSAASLVDELDRLDAFSPPDAAAALAAMARGVTAFKGASFYSQPDVRAALAEIARLVAR
ncbi:MAG: multiheme c-type cytochrome [Paracoccaceae bacterium]